MTKTYNAYTITATAKQKWGGYTHTCAVVLADSKDAAWAAFDWRECSSCGLTDYWSVDLTATLVVTVVEDATRLLPGMVAA